VSEATDKITADLATVHQIALRPLARNPLLAVVLEQAAALQELATWAGAARQLVADGAAEPEEDAP
jgi:hypothetical protein